MLGKKLSVKTQFISLLSLGLLIFVLFSLINLANSKTVIYSKAYLDKNFGSAAKIINDSNENADSSYIQFDGNLFAPTHNYTIETLFKPLVPEIAGGYVFSYKQNDDPLSFFVNSNKNLDGSFDMSFQLNVGEDLDGVCVGVPQNYLIENLTSNEVTSWHHVAVTINERGDLSLFIDGQKARNGNQIDKLCQTKGNFIIGAGWKDAISPMYMEVDDLRVSNKVRYTDNFEFAPYPLQTDPYTLALFNFNGNMNSSINNEFKGEIVGDVVFVENPFLTN